MFDQLLKQVNWKKVSLQTFLGGVAVYVGAKQQGAPENVAILGGVISALTSGGAAVHDTQKKGKVGGRVLDAAKEKQKGVNN